MIQALLVASALLTNAVSPGTITNAAGLVRAMHEDGDAMRPFDVVATASNDFWPGQPTFAIMDDSGFACVLPDLDSPPTVRAGDRVHLTGRVRRHIYGNNLRYPFFRTIEILSHGPKPRPIDVTADDLYSGRYADAPVRVTGVVADAFRDEANPKYVFVAIACGQHGMIYLASPDPACTDDRLSRLVDATVSAVGHCSSYRGLGPRAKLGYEIYADNLDELTVVSPAPESPFAVPTLGGNVYEVLNPPANGPRRRKLTGVVLAVWQKRHLLVRTAAGELSTVALAEPSPPACGETVDVAGQPETDFYHLNLSRAIWRASDVPLSFTNPPPETVSAGAILTDPSGNRRFNVDYHGRAIRLAGTVRTIKRGPDDAAFQLECDDFLVPVDASAAPEAVADLSAGSGVEVAGICLMAAENWQPQAPFPHIREMSVVLRSPQDLRVLSAPSRWTTGRLLAIIVSLLAVLLAISIWNRVLNRLVNRRGHELLRAQLDHAKAALKAEERTRLAVELHDTIAQNLASASLEIEASRELKDDLPDEILVHLDLADRTLKSCRDELRNCLWDLRSQALEVRTMDQAILRTLQPHVSDSRLAVRFNVPRSRLSESLAHMLLRIVRELVLNAIRHGRATEIRIAGSLDGNRLLCSVSDNGCGFDPDAAPGVLQGHFGLQGISERIAAIDGTFTINSTPGKGSKAIITFSLPPKDRKING